MKRKPGVKRERERERERKKERKTKETKVARNRGTLFIPLHFSLFAKKNCMTKKKNENVEKAKTVNHRVRLFS